MTSPVAQTPDSPRHPDAVSRSFDPGAIVKDLLAEQHIAPDRWHITGGALWLGVFPSGVDIPAQGWKLHLSATPVSAVSVLERAARTLLRHGVGFKVAATPE